MTRTKRFLVDRSRWLRGPRQGTRLLDLAGGMCCLGFVCRQRGIPKRVIQCTCEPNDLRDDDEADLIVGVLLEVSGTGLDHTDLTRRAMPINDDAKLSEAQRERQLSALFAEHGFEMTFIGEGRP